MYVLCQAALITIFFTLNTGESVCQYVTVTPNFYCHQSKFYNEIKNLRKMVTLFNKHIKYKILSDSSQNNVTSMKSK